jgi:hypothetical protein
MWVRLPPAAPEPTAPLDIECRATPPDATTCVDSRYLGAEFVYLLGMYLGDGVVSPLRRGVWHLRITLDKRYPGIIGRCEAAVEAVVCRNPGLVPREGCVDVSSYWKHWPCVLTQHGPGPKHRRRIELEPWQLYLVKQWPEPFVAGLIHSDGCRTLNRVKGYVYPRYFFSNNSADIRALFGLGCELLGVEYRPNRAYCISVARRGSVEILDRFIGPKA